MAGRKSISFDELSILILGMHREFVRNPKCISRTGDSVFYTSSNGIFHSVHLFFLSSSYYGVWITLKTGDGSREYHYDGPGLFSFEERRRFKHLEKFISDLRGLCGSSFEHNVCDIIPSAKEVIAERILVENEDGN